MNESIIKEIIKTFQDKIKKLEEELSQKDEEIAILEFKLYQNK